jgi:hypothetical protein
LFSFINHLYNNAIPQGFTEDISLMLRITRGAGGIIVENWQTNFQQPAERVTL